MFCSLKRGLTPNICMLCLVTINSVLFNHLCVWISFQNAHSHSAFGMLPVILLLECYQSLFFQNATSHSAFGMLPVILLSECYQSFVRACVYVRVCVYVCVCMERERGGGGNTDRWECGRQQGRTRGRTTHVEDSENHNDDANDWMGLLVSFTLYLKQGTRPTVTPVPQMQSTPHKTCYLISDAQPFATFILGKTVHQIPTKSLIYCLLHRSSHVVRLRGVWEK